MNISDMYNSSSENIKKDLNLIIKVVVDNMNISHKEKNHIKKFLINMAEQCFFEKDSEEG